MQEKPLLHWYTKEVSFVAPRAGLEPATTTDRIIVVQLHSRLLYSLLLQNSHSLHLPQAAVVFVPVNSRLLWLVNPWWRWFGRNIEKQNKKTSVWMSFVLKNKITFNTKNILFPEGAFFTRKTMQLFRVFLFEFLSSSVNQQLYSS